MLSLELGRALRPGSTLIFFDEVQMAPEVVTLSKYLVQDGRFDVVLSGSMLGSKLRGIRSMPVGYLRILDMFPLSFEEFCWAQGVPDTILSQVRTCYEEKIPVDAPVHDALIQLFRRYLVIGGMPAAVQKSITGKRDLGAVREVQTDLARLYREDIAKYAGTRSPQVKAIFKRYPLSLARRTNGFNSRRWRKRRSTIVSQTISHG